MTDIQQHRDDLKEWLKTAELCGKAGMKEAGVYCAGQAKLAADRMMNGTALPGSGDDQETGEAPERMGQGVDRPIERKAVTGASGIKRGVGVVKPLSRR